MVMVTVEASSDALLTIVEKAPITSERQVQGDVETQLCKPLPAQPPPFGFAAKQGYNPYFTHGYVCFVYAFPPSNQDYVGHAGGYGSVYGTNYGY